MKYISRRQAVSWLGFELRSSVPRSRHAARCIAVFVDHLLVRKMANGDDMITNRSAKRNGPRYCKASAFHLQSAQLYRAISYPKEQTELISESSCLPACDAV